MSTLSLRLPESLHKHLKTLVKQEGISINQFITTAVAEKMSAINTQEYLSQRAARGNKKDFEEVLAKVPDTSPSREDDLLY